MRPSSSETRLRVLTYHRVATSGSRPDLDPSLISATPDGFVRQMRLLRRSYSVVTLDAVLAAVDHRAPLPERAVLLTFDDGYADLRDYAIPTLTDLGLPATVFVPTAFPDHPELSFWADRLHRAFSGTRRTRISSPVGELALATPDQRLGSRKRLRGYLKTQPHPRAERIVNEICDALGGCGPSAGPCVLGWNDLRELAASGFSIGSHTRHHRILPRLAREEMRSEVLDAREDLERELGSTPAAFCYPNGSHDEYAVSVVRDAGYRLAFTTIHGGNDLASDDPLRLRRSNISRRTTPVLFRARLTRWGGRIDAWRHRRDAHG